MGRPFNYANVLILNCENCGEEFARMKWDHKHGRAFCSRQCWLKHHNNPERNAKVARDTIQLRADMLRDRGDKDTYRKRNGRHEHRTVAEEKLGRKLTSKDVVHHKDEDKRNNDPDNLEVITRSKHAMIHLHGEKD